MLNEALWHNGGICINNQMFAWKKWKEAGIVKITDLFSDHNQFMSTQEVLAVYGFFFVVFYLHLEKVTQFYVELISCDHL